VARCVHKQAPGLTSKETRTGLVGAGTIWAAAAARARGRGRERGGASAAAAGPPLRVAESIQACRTYCTFAFIRAPPNRSRRGGPGRL